MRLIKRSRMARTPDSVKVRAKMASGGTSVLVKMLAIRAAKIWVLPVPGPAATITGPSIVLTASSCSGFKLFKKSTLDIL